MLQRWMRWIVALLMLGASPSWAQGESPTDYRLGAGDAIKIVVYQNPDLTLETRVSESGSITYPLIGAVHVGGQTLEGAEKVIASALSKGEFVRQPQVTVSLVQVRGNQVVILGRANRPGRYPLETTNMRLTDALALAGGVGETGADIAVVSGVRDGKPYRREIDIAALFMGGEGNSDVYISGGDTIFINRAPMYYVYGEVQKPGAYRVERGMTVMQGLAQGGGPTLRGSERSLRVFRRNKETNAVQQISPAKTDLLQADDVIHVPEGLF
ncbi:MAG TPA: polysaccharide export protein EpsE [Burkholderiales bacterium]|nr:polysaccharide export protein EpsE [Burkholderiales bacterium]